MMPHWVELVITIFSSVMASSGLWLYVQKKMESKDLKSKMLLGLAHDKIIDKGLFYLERGEWITEDEWDNLYEWLYKPYSALGGNGSAEKIVNECKTNLKIAKNPPEGYKHGIIQNTCSIG